MLAVEIRALDFSEFRCSYGRDNECVPRSFQNTGVLTNSRRRSKLRLVSRLVGRVARVCLSGLGLEVG